jgi:hypothetical protein
MAIRRSYLRGEDAAPGTLAKNQNRTSSSPFLRSIAVRFLGKRVACRLPVGPALFRAGQS